MNLRELNDAIRENIEELQALNPASEYISTDQIIRFFHLHADSPTDRFLLYNLAILECLEVISDGLFRFVSMDKYVMRDPLVKNNPRDAIFDPTIGHSPASFLQLHIQREITPLIFRSTFSTQSQVSNGLLMVKGNTESCQYCPWYTIETQKCRFRHIILRMETPACFLFGHHN